MRKRQNLPTATQLRRRMEIAIQKSYQDLADFKQNMNELRLTQAEWLISYPEYAPPARKPAAHGLGYLPSKGR